MKLKYSHELATGTAQNAQQGNVVRVQALCWSPNNKMLALCRSDNIVQLFDEKGTPRDKFQTRPRDLKGESVGYTVTAMGFSPDSISIAIGQTDGIVFVYRIGEDFKMKKSITNKFSQPAPVAAVVWPNDIELFAGLMDGKIRLAHLVDRKSTKCTTAYSSDSCVARMSANNTGTELLVSFADGKIALLSIGNPDQTILKIMIRHQYPATSLCLGTDTIIAGGSDMKLFVYEKETGKVKQKFDYSKDSPDVDMSCAVISSAGQSIVVGCVSKLKIYHYNNRKKSWEEGKEKNLGESFYPTWMQWRKDGTYLAVATSFGAFHLLEAVYKRSKSNKIELNYIIPSHVLVRLLDTSQEIRVKSKYGSEILDVKLMGKDRFLVSKTNETVIITDLSDESCSEIPWVDTDDTERYYFDNPAVCMIFNTGELTLVEYGRDEILGTFRTQLVNPHVISVRVNERVSYTQMREGSQNKKIAYLLDLKSVSIVDLEYGMSLGTLTHDSKIDWLELNETGSKLLFRDRRAKLTLVDVNTLSRHTLDTNCTFVQWVPGCDVIVCQSRKQLRIWYNMDAPDCSVDQDVQGVAVEIVRENEQSVVVMKDGNNFSGVPLDERRIQFTAALEQGNLSRATAFLEDCSTGPDIPAMWSKLGKASAMACELRLALKAFSAIEDVPKSKFLDNTIKMTTKDQEDNFNERAFWKSSYVVQALMYLMVGETKLAESLYFNHEDVDGAIAMYSTLHMYEEALELARTKNHPQEASIMKDFVEEWYETDQLDLLGEVAEKLGLLDIAAAFYVEAGYPNRAARLMLKNPKSLHNRDLIKDLTLSLLEREFYEDAGEIFEATGQVSKALEAFRMGKFFDKAVKLAKGSMQHEVVPLEEEWGDHLVSLKQFDAASNHFIEAGSVLKALEAAIEARQFKKAAQIIVSLEDSESVAKYHVKIGEYFKSMNNLSEAERCFIRGGAPKKAIEMYNEHDRWEDAHRIATKSAVSKTDLHNQYMEQARLFQEEGRLSNAEKLLVTIGEVDLAISMYAKAKLYDEVIRLVETHHPEHISETLKHLAEIYATEDNYKAAEIQYLKANYWEEAVNMYQSKGLWEDAYRVARTHGGVETSRHVIYRWASTLPPDSAVKLLNKYGYINDCIDYNCHKGNYGLAEEIAQLGARDKLPEIHAGWGRYCEERQEYVEAKAHYIEANQAHLAVDMFVRAKDIQEAIATAELYAKDDLQRVLLLYAESLFAQKDFNNFESVVLRAEKPELAIEWYKRSEMWAEAFRICKQFAPQMFTKLNEEYSMLQSMRETLSKDPTEIIEHAKELERQGDYRKAIERYLQLNPTILDKDDILAKCWIRAAELAAKFLPKDQGMFVMKELAPMLENIKHHIDAAALYLQTGMFKEALNSMISGQHWPEAIRLSKEMGPDMEDYVRNKQSESLKTTGQMERLENVSAESALDLLCEKNQWSTCLERTKANEDLHAKYLAKYVTHLVKTRTPQDAIKAYVEHGAPMNKVHFSLYKALATLLFYDVQYDEFETWRDFRDIMYNVVNGLQLSGADQRSRVYIHMENLLWIMHFFACKNVFNSIPQLEILAAKVSISLLRFVGNLPVERAFYEAGLMCRQVKWDNMAFVFLNHYLDIRDAIADGAQSTIDLDHSDFLDTDIPNDCELNDKTLVPNDLHDAVKEWVLTASMDGNIQQELKKDDRNVFEGSLLAGGETYEPCILTGYPVLNPKISFRTTKKFANKEDWNRFVVACRSQPNNQQLSNVMEFISQWCGPNPSYSY